MPLPSSDEKNPNSRVSGSTFALHRSPEGAYLPLDVEAEKGFSPESEFQTGKGDEGGIQGTIYRYVVWRNDPSCPDAECPGPDDYKQLVVAVKPTRTVSQGGEAGYVEVQSAVTAPPEETELGQQQKEEKEKKEKEQQEEEQKEEEANGAGDVTAQQFFLADTACAASGVTERQEITGDHLLHNTLGTCASGLHTGSDSPARRTPCCSAARRTRSPKTNRCRPCTTTPTTSTSSRRPDTDKGVQIRRDDTSGCHYDPTGVTNPESQVHRWVTDPMPKEFEMGGKVTLEFYTRTLNDALYTGTLCVYLFERKETGPANLPVAEDTMLVDEADGNPYWTYEPEGNGYWPRNSWAKIRLTMEFQEAPTPHPRRQPARRRAQRRPRQHPRRRDPDHVRPPQLRDPARGRHEDAARTAASGGWRGRRGVRLPRRAARRQLHRRSSRTGCRAANRSSGRARAAPPAARRSPPTTTSRSSPGSLLRGRARCCGASISPRYPLTELALGLLYAATVLVLWDDPGEIALGLVFVTRADGGHPDRPRAADRPQQDPHRRRGRWRWRSPRSPIPAACRERAIAAAAAGGLLFLVALAYPRGMGLGDVKLAATMGLFLGRNVAPAIFVALLAGGAVGLAMIAVEGASARKRAIPFAPFLALGGVVGLLAGDQLVDWYLGTF